MPEVPLTSCSVQGSQHVWCLALDSRASDIRTRLSLDSGNTRTYLWSQDTLPPVSGSYPIVKLKVMLSEPSLNRDQSHLSLLPVGPSNAICSPSEHWDPRCLVLGHAFERQKQVEAVSMNSAATGLLWILDLTQLRKPEQIISTFSASVYLSVKWEYKWSTS